MVDKFERWQVRQSLDQRERDRVNFLNQPVPNHVVNNPALTRLVKVKVLRAFMVRMTPAQPGDVVEIPYALARDMIAIKKAELVELNDNER